MAERWYKATRKFGVSIYDHNFVYSLGMNIHPNPDRSNKLCSQGIHLAKTLEATKRLSKEWEEIYLAEPGVILAEDEEKARVASCFIIRKLNDDEVHNGIMNHIFLQNPLCGWDWIRKHGNITQSIWEQQMIEIVAGNNKLKLKANVNPRDIRNAISAIIK